jgi:cysteine-S-conjugate beta-lyase
MNEYISIQGVIIKLTGETFMTYHFDNFIDRLDSDSVKWHIFDQDVLPLWVADMDFRSPEPVMEALQKRIQHGVFGYPTLADGLVDAAVNWVSSRHDWQISPSQVAVIPAVISGFNLATQAYARGRSVLIQTPAYPPFFHVAPNARISQVDNVLTPGKDCYEVDFDAFETAAAADVGVFLFCNPQNPTGRVFTRPELERMAEICLRHDITIVSDEIHSDLVYSDQRHIPIASLSPEVADKTVTLIAPSKTFNIAGLKTAIAILPSSEAKQHMINSDPGLMGHTNLLGMVAAEAAYRHGLPWLQELLVYLEANRAFLMEFIRNEMPGIRVFTPQGTYLAWLDCRAYNLPETPCEFFIHQAKVGLNNGADFGNASNGFVRLNFGSPRAMLVEALNRMRDTLKQQEPLMSK